MSFSDQLRSLRTAIQDYERARTDRKVAYAKVRSAASAEDNALWRMGRVLLEIHETESWRESFRYWQDFVKNAVGYSDVAVRSWMRVAKRYTDDEIARRGFSKLMKLSQIDDPILCEEIERAIDGGATNTEIEILMGRKPSSGGKNMVFFPAGSVSTRLSNDGVARLEVRGGYFEYRVRKNKLEVTYVPQRGGSRRGSPRKSAA